MKLGEQACFQLRDVLLLVHRVCLHKSNFPKINLPIRNDVRSGGGEMTANSALNTLLALANVDWRFVQVAKYVDADLIRQSLDLGFTIFLDG